MLQWLLQLDYWLFDIINVKGHNNVLDAIIPFFRNQYFWLPLYIFLVTFIYKNFGSRGLIWILFLVFTFMFCDVVSATFMKPFFARLRPCQDFYWNGKISLLVDCGSGKSFPSTHSSNHFGISFYIIYTLKKYFKWVTIPAVFWAILVAFSQVYVGVHYPLDVIVGALLGITIGVFCAKYFNLRIGL